MVASGRVTRVRNRRLFAVATLVAAGVAAMVVLPSASTRLFVRSAPISGTISADAPRVSVVDGDTLRLQDTVVRLEGVDAPPRGQSCRSADGVSFDCGAAATRALAALVKDHLVSCQLHGRDDAGFAQAKCQAAGTELNRALVASGFARARGSEPTLTADENSARTEHRGLWRDAANGNF